MKKTACTLIMLVSLAATTGANANDTAVQTSVEQIKSQFNLNEQQASRIAQILSRAGMSKEEKRDAHRDKRINRRVKHMTRKLGLTETQAADLKIILTRQSEQMRMAMEQNKTEIANSLGLSAEQTAKLAEMRDRKGKGHKGRGGKKRHGKRGGHGSECKAH